MWIAQLDRLPTRTRIASWGITIEITCCLCSVYDESRDHLLLRCEVRDSIWRLIQTRLGLPQLTFITWDSFLAWTDLESASSPSILWKLVAQATIYNIWKERNKRLHLHVSSPPSIIFRIIDKQIRNTINARWNRKKFRNLMAFWRLRD